MAAIHVTSFGGMIPAVDVKLLPNGNASYARNCRLLNGKLQPFKRLNFINQSTYPAIKFNGELGYDSVENTLFTSAAEGQYPILTRMLNQNAYNYAYTGYPYQLSLRTFSIAASVIRGTDYSGTTARALGVPPGPACVNQGVSPQQRSKYPTARRYCATYVNMFGEESTPGTISADIYCFEGDSISISINPSFANPPTGLYPISKIRLYRTASEYESGEELGNKLNTDFLLVTEFAYTPSSFVFVDDIPTHTIPGDLLLSREFFNPRQIDAVAMVQLDAGYLAIAYVDGTISISERFMFHAFPLRNQITIPESISSMVAYYDMLIVTCRNNSAYKVTVRPDAAGISFDVQRYPDRYAAEAARALVGTNFGALYSSPRGLVALSRDQQVLVTKDMILPQQWNTIFAPTIAGWAEGYYIGVGTAGGENWIMDVPDQISGQTQFGQLVYVDSQIIPARPNPVPGLYSMVYGRDRLFIFDAPYEGTNLYEWSGLERPEQLGEAARYVWRSKTFVTRAPTTFAAAKITFTKNYASIPDGMGSVIFRLFGDGALRCEINVYGNEPFRLPHLYKATNWVFELEGEAYIDEVHIATSMTELNGESR
jgi:hypothetical protein